MSEFRKYLIPVRVGMGIDEDGQPITFRYVDPDDLKAMASTFMPEEPS